MSETTNRAMPAGGAPRGASRIAPIVLRDLVPRSPIFTTDQVAKLAKTMPESASRALGRLEHLGLLTRLTRGLWADTRHREFSPYAVVPFLLAPTAREPIETAQSLGYVSFISALHLQGLLSQIPGAIHVAVLAQRAPVRTPLATYEFHQLHPSLFGGHEPGDAYGRFQLATPTKALLDTLYLSARRGRQFSRLPELEPDGTLHEDEMRRWIARIEPPSFQRGVAARWERLAEELEIHAARRRPGPPTRRGHSGTSRSRGHRPR